MVGWAWSKRTGEHCHVNSRQMLWIHFLSAEWYWLIPEAKVEFRILFYYSTPVLSGMRASGLITWSAWMNATQLRPYLRTVCLAAGSGVRCFLGSDRGVSGFVSVVVLVGTHRLHRAGRSQAAAGWHISGQSQGKQHTFGRTHTESSGGFQMKGKRASPGPLSWPRK